MAYRKTWDPNVTVFGWWIRFIWGITFKPERIRVSKFDGRRLIAMRVWGDPHSARCARLVGVMWRRAEHL
jgi:hypothetical protein